MSKKLPLVFACDDGGTWFVQVQRAGKRPMQADEFLRGMATKQGLQLL